MQVQALYDFVAVDGTGELGLAAGDVLAVIRTDVGEGWWEGTNARGETGLFPEAYVGVTGSIVVSPVSPRRLKFNGPDRSILGSGIAGIRAGLSIGRRGRPAGYGPASFAPGLRRHRRRLIVWKR